jgi:hypothetical protein
VVISIIKTQPDQQQTFAKTMNATTNSPALEKLSLTAIISCACSVLYFVVSNLLA